MDRFRSGLGIVDESHRKFDFNPFPNCFPCSYVALLHQASVVKYHCATVMSAKRTIGLSQESRYTIWVVIQGPSPRAIGVAWYRQVTTNTFWNFQRCQQRGRFLDKHEIAAEKYEFFSSALMDVRAVKRLLRRNLGYQHNDTEHPKSLKQKEIF